MKSLLILILSGGLLLFNNCSGNHKHSIASSADHEAGAQLIVYGSPDCIHCIHFISELDSAGIKYDFRAVTTDTAQFNEMMRKIRTANIKGYISYPVVDIRGQVLVHPSIEKLKEYLK